MSRVRREGEGNTRELLMDDHQLGMREERVDMYMSVFLFTWKEDLACDDFIQDTAQGPDVAGIGVLRLESEQFRSSVPTSTTNGERRVELRGVLL